MQFSELPLVLPGEDHTHMFDKDDSISIHAQQFHELMDVLPVSFIR